MAEWFKAQVSKTCWGFIPLVSPNLTSSASMKIKFLNKKKIVAIEKNKIIGYLKFSYPDDSSGKRNLEVGYIYVKSPYRRKKIASQLLKFLSNHFKNVVWISLWTGKQAEIDKSHDLYKKFGFKQKAYQADYYKKGIGTRLFVKRVLK